MALEKEDTLDLNRLFQRAIFEVNFSPSSTRFQVVCQCGSNKGSVTWSQVPGHRKWFGTNNPPLLLLNDLGSLTCLRWQLSSKFSASCFFFQASCLPDFCLVSLTVLASLQFNSVRYTANAYSTRGPDEVIAKSSIWLKLYQMNICNLSRKDQQSFFQNMN